jgi:catechol 2,3-dioxygenase-like lactoylglutathione lyase family enzyme
MTRFRVDHLDHVELFVPDRYAAAAWYERTLGLRVLPAHEHWANNPGGPLMISSDEGQTKLALFTGEPRGARPTAGFHLVAFRVTRAGFADFRKHIATNPVHDEQGNELREVPMCDHGTAWSVYFCDPYGHRLEVTTYDVPSEASPDE